jgi:hypothetical protein
VPEAQKLILNQPPGGPNGNFKLKREVTLIVLEITTLITALTGISYGVIANCVTAKKTKQHCRGYLKPGRSCH